MNDVLSLRQAILATIHYFDLLDFPITGEELDKYLYGWQASPLARHGALASAPRDVIENEISRMPEIESDGEFYFLSGRRELAHLRHHRQPHVDRLWKKASRWSWLFVLCPFVRMVAVCNSLSYGNVKPSSDIDLFVVTAEGRLSTCRFFMKIFTQFFGIRVHGDRRAGRFCLSFFVTERAMNLMDVAHEFDPHLAYFVRTMKPIYGERVARDFFHTNAQWIVKYFKQKISPDFMHARRHRVASFFRRVFEIKLRFLRIFSEKWCENWLAKREHEYRKKFSHSTGVIMRKNMFKFHEKDPREEIAERFQERLRNLRVIAG